MTRIGAGAVLVATGIFLVLLTGGVLDQMCLSEGFNPDCPGLAPLVLVAGIGTVVGGLAIVSRAAAAAMLLAVGMLFTAGALLAVPLLDEMPPGTPDHRTWGWAIVIGLVAFLVGALMALHPAATRRV
jgi:hypothetical protein